MKFPLSLLAGLLSLATACAADLARASSAAIGCAAKEIDVDDISVGWSETSWSARCRGLTFHCAGENGASCTPDRTALPPGGASPTPHQTQQP